jgi:hypothetical protein
MATSRNGRSADTYPPRSTVVLLLWVLDLLNQINGPQTPSSNNDQYLLWVFRLFLLLFSLEFWIWHHVSSFASTNLIVSRTPAFDVFKSQQPQVSGVIPSRVHDLVTPLQTHIDGYFSFQLFGLGHSRISNSSFAFSRSNFSWSPRYFAMCPLWIQWSRFSFMNRIS